MDPKTASRSARFHSKGAESWNAAPGSAATAKKGTNDIPPIQEKSSVPFFEIL